jgi:hypothetical protein
MIISHQCHFVVFFDPLSSHQWLQLALSPWADQHVSSTGRPTHKTPFHIGMTPTEAKAAFTRQGLDFDNYTRIAIVHNPYRRLAALYDRIRASDPLWRLKARSGLHTPDFRSWLVEGHYASKGPLARLLPGWRRQAAMSTEEWAAGLIDSFVRAEFAGVDLPAAMRQLDVVPVVNFAARQPQHRFAEMLRYDSETMGVIGQRYANDLRLYQGLRTRLDLVA